MNASLRLVLMTLLAGAFATFFVYSPEPEGAKMVGFLYLLYLMGEGGGSFLKM